MLRPADGVGGGSGLRLGRRRRRRCFESTVDYWRRWLSKCTYSGRWREMVHRSALALKLLTFEPTRGDRRGRRPAACPRTSAGGRNWDYRYTWIRDAAFTLYAFMRIGFTEEAGRFMDWLKRPLPRARPATARLQIMYGIDGRPSSTEETLDHLEGYRGSRPVRIGNGAVPAAPARHLRRADGLGLPLQQVRQPHLVRRSGSTCGASSTGSATTGSETDEGIWEVRGGRRHFVYSKLMCWVALDRGLRLAEKRSFPADRARWLQVRDEIYEDIMTHGWSEKRKAFVQSYERRRLDASSLMMPLVFFISPTDPRMLSHPRRDQPLAGAGRAGLGQPRLPLRPEARAGRAAGRRGDLQHLHVLAGGGAVTRGRTDRAAAARTRGCIFEQMLGYANHLGLYAEETGPSGEALGNFPQAFTHLALISAAFNLDRTLGGPKR